jgi:signal transduction histidine kinase
MGRRAKPKKGKPDRKSAKNDGSQVRDLEKRLAEALQREAVAAKREAEALEQQAATSKILELISSSPTDIQPVFDMIAENARRLCDGHFCAVFRFDGELIHLAGHHGLSADGAAAYQRGFPLRVGRNSAIGRAIVDRAVAQVPDVQADPEYGQLTIARAVTFRAIVAVPMLRDGKPLGGIAVSRSRVGPFSDKQLALLGTFADQAVIAIENVRLFQELQARTQELARSVDGLRALSDVGQVVSSTLDLQEVLTTIITHAVHLSKTEGGTIYELAPGERVFVPSANYGIADELVESLRQSRLRIGDESVVGRAAGRRTPVQIPDLVDTPGYPLAYLAKAGFRALLAVPLIRDEEIVGMLVVRRREPGEFPTGIVDLLQTFAAQSVLAIQNARLFLEIKDKGRQLEVASQHKSEFLASMSHELRTPLNAIIGFSDVLLQGMFGEMSEKQTEYLQDILASGQHLLSLINDILDLSKIEAGRMELDLADFYLPSAIADALLLMRERASRRELALERHVDERLGEVRADQRKVKQVLLNLLSNAVKFTPEGGRIDVRAALVDGTVEISVTDTGIGIAPEDHDAVFEEFRQVGKADKKAEGTGLGLALCRKFVELHGGRIWVKSQIGAGSTFTFALPLRQ